MPIRVEIEGKGMVAEFPDGTDQGIIDAAIKRDYFGGAVPTTERSWSDVPGEAVSNIIPSAGRFVEGVVQPFIHPIKTVEGISKVGSGALRLSEDTSAWDAVKGFFMDRYGSVEGLKKTIATDPVGFAADISTVLTGGGSLAAKAPGMVGKVGAGVRAVGEAVNPIGLPGKAVGAIRETIGATKLPEELYSRTMKMPPGSLREEGRARVVNTLVREERLPLGKATSQKIREITKTTGDSIDGTLAGLVKTQGSEIDISVLVKSLDELKKTYKNRPNPQPYYDAIDAVKQDYLNHSYINSGGKISLIDAHDLKKGTYQEIQSYYMKQQKPETGRIGIQNDVDASAKAGAASALRQAILEHPDVPASVKTDLTRQAGVMNARKWVERATNRGGNLDPVSLSGMMFGILVEKGFAPVAAWRIAASQPVMSRLAIGLAHGSETARGIGNVVRPVALGSRATDILSGAYSLPTP